MKIMEIYRELFAEREMVAGFMRRLYRCGLTSCSGGNISVRVNNEYVLITPSALDKGELHEDQVVLVSMSGKPEWPEVKPTIEAGMHLEIFRQRPDVNAVCHAHPVYATTCACTGTTIDTGITPETLMTIRRMVTVPFHPAGTTELAEAVAAAMKTADVAVLQNHGVVAVGKTMLAAFDRLEISEIAAKTTLLAAVLGKKPSLEPVQQQAVVALFG